MPSPHQDTFITYASPANWSTLHRQLANVEWPTLALWTLIFGGWTATLATTKMMPPALTWLALVGITAWYLSLQHEFSHGHPTRSAKINRILGLTPIALWYPFDDYREQHLTHHQDQFLTQPGLDPESNYFYPQPPQPKWKLFLWKSQRTVAGRFLLGPGLSIYQLLGRAVLSLRERNSAAILMWTQHLVLVGAVLFLAQHGAGVTVWQYATASYFGLGLSMLRSLYEHRPAAQPSHRIVVNEAAWPWRLLYLNNNYHAVHHMHPELPWYQIAKHYHADREGYLHRNGGFLIPGYAWLIRHHLWRPVDSPLLAQAR